MINFGSQRSRSHGAKVRFGGLVVVVEVSYSIPSEFRSSSFSSTMNYSRRRKRVFLWTHRVVHSEHGDIVKDYYAVTFIAL